MEQLEQLKIYIDERFKIFQDQQNQNLALLINELKPGTFEKCSCCGKVTTKPFRNHEDHGDNFCSPTCMAIHIGCLEEEVTERAMAIADRKLANNKLWNEICDVLSDGQNFEHRGAEILDTSLQVVPSEIECNSCQDLYGEEIEYAYSAEDGNHFFECRCLTCKHEFEIKAQTMIKAKGNACPKCKETQKRSKKG